MSRVAIAFALAFALAGCQAADPCRGKSGSCLAIEVSGSGVGPLDELAVTVSDGAGGKQSGGTGVVTPQLELPVQFAALLRAGTSGAVTVEVVGRHGGAPVASGSAAAVAPASGEARVTVVLSPTGSHGDGGSNQDGGIGTDASTDAGGDGGNVAGDVSLVPPAFDIGRVAATQTGTAMFTVNATGDVTLAAASLSPSQPGLAIDTASTCANMQTLHAGDSCDLVITYSPTGAASIGSTLTVPTSMGFLTGLIYARSPGPIIETVPGPTPPSFNAVFAVDGRTAYAVGQPNAVWRRDAAGWSARTGPGSSTSNVTGVWAAGDDDLYVVMAQSGKVFHSTDRAKSWTTLTPGLSTNAVSVSGSDGKTVFVAGSSGDIALGSASSSWTGDHAADGTAWAQLDANSGVVLGTRASEVDLRTGPAAWSPLLDETGIATFHAVWGTSASDFYAAGQKISCSTTGSCGVVYQKVGNSPPVPSTVSGCDSFNGVFGMSGGTIYAVCDSGIIATSNSGGAFTASIYGPAQLNGVHGAAGELYAVGVAGTIMHIIE